MKLLTLRRNRTDALPGIVGAVRVDRRTKDLAKRLRPGDIAVIDHADLDRASAESIVQSKPAVVVNASQSCTASYPNLGPGIIADAGIPLIDNVGETLFIGLKDGERLRVDGATLYRDSMPIGEGELLDRARVDELMVLAKEGLTTQLDAFTANTSEYLRREHDLLLEGAGFPDVKTRFEKRHTVVVTRAYDYRQDLAMLKSYIREYDPILIGVEDGADALVEAGYQPDMIVGDMQTVSEETLKLGAELVVHANGKLAGTSRLERLGLGSIRFDGAGTDEDAAMLLADAKNTDLIVAVGTHGSLPEFLDRGQAAMSSTFLTRMRVGPKLMDARGVGRLHHTRIRMWQLMLLLVAGLIAVAVSIGATPQGSEWVDALQGRWDELVNWMQGLIS